MSWQEHAATLADAVTHRGSRWRDPVAGTPRHLLVPKWWDGRDMRNWTLRDGPASQDEWMRAAYSDETLLTEVGGLHADHARPGDHPDGPPTSSSTLPGLVVRMLRHAQVYDGCDILDVATGPGYSAALLSKRLGDSHVTSVDVNPYLTKAAEDRLAGIGHAPEVLTADATGPLPGSYDRIVAMASFRPVPASWLAALRPGGRLVTVIGRTSLILTANKTSGGDWAAIGRIEWDRAMFMPARPGGYSGETRARSVRDEVDARARGRTTMGRYPVVNISDAWELISILEVTAPGIEHDYRTDADGHRTAWMIHPDGSWARATGPEEESPQVTQGGPRRLWDILDDLRGYWLSHGYFQLYGATAYIRHDGTIRLARGKWRGTIAASH
jgi:protein-L-isoaspartate O-methyltransferase